MTPILFAKALLAALSLPVSDNNVAALLAIQKQEGGHQLNRAWFNPLNTMRSMPGAREAGLAVRGIKAYSSWDEGVAATALTLRQPNMRAIVEALGRSASPEETLTVFAASPWGWYEYKDGVRVPHPYPGATALVKSPEASAKYGSTPYRAAPGSVAPPREESPRQDVAAREPAPAKKRLASGVLIVLVGAAALTGLLLFSRPVDPWSGYRSKW